MLNSLSISNFTTVDKLSLELATGFVAITGETGAGKSVLLDAISLALGERVQGKPLREESRPAEISACFDIENSDHQWLETLGLTGLEDNELVLRRVINPDGRSRAFINDSLVNLSTLRELAPRLVEQHSQHAHYSLLNKNNHLQLVDSFGKLIPQQKKVEDIASQFNALSIEVENQLASNENSASQLELLRFQLDELEALDLKNDEAELLERELKQLGNADAIAQAIDQALQFCESDGSASGAGSIAHTATKLRESLELVPALKAAVDLLDSATIQINEAGSELQAVSQALDADPQRLQHVEQRLDTLYGVARKHRIKTAELGTLLEKKQQDLERLENIGTNIESLRLKQSKIAADFYTAAEELSRQRRTAISKLEKAVNQRLSSLSMKHCKFKISCSTEDSVVVDDNALPARLPLQGLDSVEMKISTVPGKPPRGLAEVASGGELSRISLAIQVAISKTRGAKTLIFDEVDVGIGGGVAEVVGQLIHELSDSRQILCVTHLAQVASKADHHYLVEKSVGRKQVSTRISALETGDRRQELARMVSGIDVTDASLAQADELLATV